MKMKKNRIKEMTVNGRRVINGNKGRLLLCRARGLKSKINELVGEIMKRASEEGDLATAIDDTSKAFPPLLRSIHEELVKSDLSRVPPEEIDSYQIHRDEVKVIRSSTGIIWGFEIMYDLGDSIFAPIDFIAVESRCFMKLSKREQRRLRKAA